MDLSGIEVEVGRNDLMKGSEGYLYKTTPRKSDIGAGLTAAL